MGWGRRAARALAAAALAAICAGAAAQTYPNRPVRIVLGYGVGGTGDIVFRVVAQKLSERLGQQFIIDNRPSAGGIVASQLVAKATPDGYTLIMVATGNFVMTPSLFKSLPFDPVADFDMITQVAYFSFALVVNADAPWRSVKDFIADAKANPRKLNVGTVSIGSAQYLAAEYFKSLAGVEITTVPYKTTGDVLSSVRAGNVQVGVETLGTIASQIRSGALRAIAVTTTQRFPDMPDVPTVIESGLPGYDVSGWNGLAAPAKTPRAVVDRLNKEVNAVLALPDVQKRFLELGVVAKGGTPEQMKTVLLQDTTLWRGVIEKAKIPKQ